MRATILDFCQDGYDERSEFFESNKLAGGIAKAKTGGGIAAQLTSGWCGFWRRNAEPNSRRSCGH
jgi:hypothetical protein